MKLNEIYTQKQDKLMANAFMAKRPVISFEVFPPKGENEELKRKNEALLNELKELSAFDPEFISVTYGAGGSTQQNSLDLVLNIKNKLNITPMPHFTCVGATREEIKDYISIIEEHKIKNILALRGDPPKDQKEFKKPVGGFGYANELVEFIKDNSDLSIGVAGYPECHQTCESIDLDIENLKRKVDAGAELIITQIFYNNQYFFDFMAKTKQEGIEIPIVPGIIPITNIPQIERMTQLCGTEIPESFVKRLKDYQDDKEAVKEIGIEFATYQCQQLIDSEVPGLHFCTLNKSFATKAVLENLSLEY